jgi:alkylation response protein AidB-like acyl-CoA dehydrogenase
VAKATFDGKQLSGRVQGVLDGGGATHVLVYLADGRPAVAAVDAEGVRASLVPSLDRTRPLLDVTFEDAPAVLLSAANDPLAARTRVLDAGRVMLAADTLGAAQSMFDQAVAFAKGAYIRPRDRLIPGRQAHARRSRHRA